MYKVDGVIQIVRNALQHWTAMAAQVVGKLRKSKRPRVWRSGRFSAIRVDRYQMLPKRERERSEKGGVSGGGTR